MQGFANMPLLQCQAVEGLRVKGPDFGIAVQQGGQAVGVWQVDFLSLYGVPAAVGVLGHKQAAFHQQRQGSRLYFFRRSSVHGGGSGAALSRPQRSTILCISSVASSWAAAAGSPDWRI